MVTTNDCLKDECGGTIIKYKNFVKVILGNISKAHQNKN